VLFSLLPFEISMMSVALIGALSYGCGDFLGGRASLRLSPAGAVALAQCAATIMALKVFRYGVPNWPGVDVIGSGLLGGVAYAAGLLFLYQGLAHGRIGIVAPVCGVFSILVPLIGDLVLERHIQPNQLAGIAICTIAIVLLASTPEAPVVGLPSHFSFRLGVMSGVGYGVADVCLGTMAPEDGAAGLLVARSVAALIAIGMLLLAIIRSGGFGAGETDRVQVSTPPSLAWVRPPRFVAMLPPAMLAATAGVLDAMGQMSYVHAATRGSMAVAASLVALFPAVVVVLAVVVLREQVVLKQYLGLAASVVGALVMSA
jgi:drug/metabolite transporter (DMT)-like permease